jgi:hypothetical protein
MKLGIYSSLTAFLAHYAALRAARASSASMSTNDTAMLVAMDALIAELGDADRAALTTGSDAPLAGAAARHRARAELNLRRLLAARGVLAG